MFSMLCYSHAIYMSFLESMTSTKRICIQMQFTLTSEFSYHEFELIAFPFQSFADLWVDFLLKETEEREKRESAGSTGKSMDDLQDKSPKTSSASPSHSNQRFSTGTISINSNS